MSRTHHLPSTNFESKTSQPLVRRLLRMNPGYDTKAQIFFLLSVVFWYLFCSTLTSLHSCFTVLFFWVFNYQTYMNDTCFFCYSPCWIFLLFFALVEPSFVFLGFTYEQSKLYILKKQHNFFLCKMMWPSTDFVLWKPLTL